MIEIIIGGHKTLWDLEDALRYVGVSLLVNDNGYLRHPWHWGGSGEYVHRELMNAGPDDYVDHANGNKLDNRRANLRICNQQENSRNKTKRSDNKSGVTGVHFCKTRKKWVAQINTGERVLLLGRFLDFETAVQKRREAEGTWTRN